VPAASAGRAAGFHDLAPRLEDAGRSRPAERFSSPCRWLLPRPPPEALLRSLRFALAGLLEWLRPERLPPVLEAPRLPALRLESDVDREVALPDFMMSLL
jgi:hypothetical protein